jgi:branched-chain amino acid transport system permease protein
MRKLLRSGPLLWSVVLVIAIALPFFLTSFRVSQFTLVLSYAVVVLGLNLLLGYSGQISLGHGAFFALGAYVTAVLVAKEGWPHLLTVPAAAIVCGLAGYAVGVPALRLHGLYLALVTLGIAISFPQLIKRFDEITEGTQGLSSPQPAAPGFLDWLADDQYLYFFNLAIAIPMFLLAMGLVRGKVGRALIAIRDNEIAAKSFGVDLPFHKTRAFAISAAYAGVAGSMFAFTVGFVAPESFAFALSFQFLAAVVVGGVATIAGAVFGALFIEFVPVYAADINEALASVIYGAVLIVFMYVLPTGVMGLLRRISGIGKEAAEPEKPAALAPHVSPPAGTPAGAPGAAEAAGEMSLSDTRRSK